MDKYETIEVVGEGSYGIVIKCRHRQSGQIVAIKKFLETEEDVHARKMAFREIRMLKKLRHDNLVNLIQVFRRRKRFYLVFEYLDHTVLEELEGKSGGLGLRIARRHIYQVIRGLSFCHVNYIMHRDVKPENVLVSPNGVVKLCDFGFARFVTGANESCTDYVATRWYRAPELLVGDRRYGRPVDVWAVGCLYAEMVTGQPLFPGDSDLDQLYQITRLIGNLCGKHRKMITRENKRRVSRGASLDAAIATTSKTSTFEPSLRSRFPTWTFASVDFLSQCLRMDPENRPTCANLLEHPLFVQDSFAQHFLQELLNNIAKESCQYGALSRAKTTTTGAAEESTNYNASAADKWRMRLTDESASTNNDAPSTENSPSSDPPSDPTLSAISRNYREPLSAVPSISVVPNTNYIKPLGKNESLGISKRTAEENTCSLPALLTLARNRGTSTRVRV